jgi:hypothetical protein
MLSTLIALDIVEYLDSGKIGARSVAGDRALLSQSTIGTERTKAVAFAARDDRGRQSR